MFLFNRRSVKQSASRVIFGILIVLFSICANAQTSIVIEAGQKFAEKFLKLDSKNGVVIINNDARSHKLTFQTANGKPQEAEVLSGASAHINLAESGIYDVKFANNPAMSMTLYVAPDVRRVGEDSQYYF